MNRFIKAFLSMFKKKRIKFLGRMGLRYCDYDNRLYYVDSELLAAKEFDLIIFEKDIYLDDGNGRNLLPENERREILSRVKLELKNMGLRYVVSSSRTA